MTPLPRSLKRAVEDAFHDNSLLSSLSPQEREEAARWYEDFAAQVKGSRARLARLYNIERAKFLRGQTAWIARSAAEYAEEIGHSQTGDGL